MELKYNQEHKSITQFNSIELEDFTILTGYNGSGKSHLLESLLNGNSQINDITINEIVLFDYKTFYLENEPIINTQQLNQDKLNVWQKFSNQQNGRNNLNYKGTLSNYKQQLGLENYNKILEIGQGKPLLKIPISDFEDKDLYEKYNRYRSQVYGFLGQNQKDHSETPAIKSLCLTIPIALDELSEDDFNDYYTPIVLKNNFLPSQIGKLFIDYWYKYHLFLYQQWKKDKTKEFDETILNIEFEKKHGPRPWKLIEDILVSFSSFEYTINNPENIEIDLTRAQSFSLTLQHKTKGIKIPFNNLSSGEKILFSLVLSIYKSVGDKVFPTLLLLDEIDASLHPSQIQNLLNVINKVFVNDNNVKVILATHSPTTTALAEEKNIFVVNKESENRIEKQSKQKALSILSEGFITLEEGLTIIDQTTNKDLTIFTEGNNTDYIRKAIELISPEILNRIDFVDNLKNRTGKGQLSTLFDLFSRMPHKSKILFVFDCDVTTNFTDAKNTYHYIIPKNGVNEKVTKGIENLFPEEIFADEFYPRKTKEDGGYQASLDKQLFLRFILDSNDKKLFDNFNALVDRINEMMK